MTCTVSSPTNKTRPLAKLIRFALSDGERVVLEISTVDRGDLRDPQQTIAHESNDCRIPQPCKRILGTGFGLRADTIHQIISQGCDLSGSLCL